MVGAKARRAAEHAALARDHQHDHHRIGAGKMLGVARRAIAPPSGLHHLRRCAAIRTEAVPRMPADQRLGLGERRQMRGFDQALDRDRAQVGDFQIVARLERLDAAASSPKPKRGASCIKTEKHLLAHGAERTAPRPRENSGSMVSPTASSPPVRRRSHRRRHAHRRRILPSLRHRYGNRRRDQSSSPHSQAAGAGRVRGGRTLSIDAGSHSAASRSGRGFSRRIEAVAASKVKAKATPVPSSSLSRKLMKMIPFSRCARIRALPTASHELFASERKGRRSADRRKCLGAAPHRQMLPPADAPGAVAGLAKPARLSALHRGAWQAT